MARVTTQMKKDPTQRIGTRFGLMAAPMRMTNGAISKKVVEFMVVGLHEFSELVEVIDSKWKSLFAGWMGSRW